MYTCVTHNMYVTVHNEVLYNLVMGVFFEPVLVLHSSSLNLSCKIHVKKYIIIVPVFRSSALISILIKRTVKYKVK